MATGTMCRADWRCPSSGHSWPVSPRLSGGREIHRVSFLSLNHSNCVLTAVRRSLVSVFPAGINVGATWSKRLAYERGKAMGLESRDKGITVQLGPVAGGIGRVSCNMSPRHIPMLTFARLVS
jgi:beta-glucosidase